MSSVTSNVNAMQTENEEPNQSASSEENSLRNNDNLLSMLSDQTKCDTKVIENIYSYYDGTFSKPTKSEEKYLKDFIHRVIDYLVYKKKILLLNSDFKRNGTIPYNDDESEIFRALNCALHIRHLDNMEDITKLSNLLLIKDDGNDCSIGELFR